MSTSRPGHIFVLVALMLGVCDSTAVTCTGEPCDCAPEASGCDSADQLTLLQSRTASQVTQDVGREMDVAKRMSDVRKKPEASGSVQPAPPVNLAGASQSPPQPPAGLPPAKDAGPAAKADAGPPPPPAPPANDAAPAAKADAGPPPPPAPPANDAAPAAKADAGPPPPPAPPANDAAPAANADAGPPQPPAPADNDAPHVAKADTRETAAKDVLAKTHATASKDAKGIDSIDEANGADKDAMKADDTKAEARSGSSSLGITVLFGVSVVAVAAVA